MTTKTCITNFTQTQTIEALQKITDNLIESRRQAEEMYINEEQFDISILKHEKEDGLNHQ